MVSVNSSGNATAGEMLSLMCSITRAVNITGDIRLQWIGPGGNQVVSDGAVIVGSLVTLGATTSLSLQFTPLFTSHGGEYICRGDLVSQDIMYTISALQDVIVRGKISIYDVHKKSSLVNSNTQCLLHPLTLLEFLSTLSMLGQVCC